jgi:hypothetical protein
MVDAIPYLVPNQFQESIFPSITRQKIPAQDIQYKQYTHWNIRPDDSEISDRYNSRPPKQKEHGSLAVTATQQSLFTVQQNI